MAMLNNQRVIAPIISTFSPLINTDHLGPIMLKGPHFFSRAASSAPRRLGDFEPSGQARGQAQVDLSAGMVYDVLIIVVNSD